MTAQTTYVQNPPFLFTQAQSAKADKELLIYIKSWGWKRFRENNNVDV